MLSTQHRVGDTGFGLGMSQYLTYQVVAAGMESQCRGIIQKLDNNDRLLRPTIRQHVDAHNLLQTC